MRILFGIALTLVLSLSACGNGGAGKVRRRAQEAIDSHELSEGRAKPTSQQSMQQEERRSQSQSSTQQPEPKADKKPASMKTPAPLGPKNADADQFKTPGPFKNLGALFEESYKEMKEEDTQFLKGFLKENGETIVKELPPEKKQVLASIIIAGLSKASIFEIKLAICLTEEATKNDKYPDREKRFEQITKYCRAKVKPQAGYTPIKYAASKNDPKLTKLINRYLEKSTSYTKSLLSMNNLIDLATKVNLAESFPSPRPVKETTGEKTLEAAEDFELFPEDSVDFFATLLGVLKTEFEKENADQELQNLINAYLKCLKRDLASPPVVEPYDPDPESI